MNVSSSRVVVTGLGAITALGTTREKTWEQVITGQTGITQIRAWDVSPYKTKLAAEIIDFKPLDHFSPKRARRLDRCHQLAIVAAREALEDAALAISGVDRTRVGVIIGTSLGGTVSAQKYDRHLVHTGRHRRHYLYSYPFHVCLDELTTEFGFLGPRSVVSTACTASTIAIGYAMHLIRAGQADAMLTGGVDPLSEFSFAGFSSMQNVSAQPCAPFSLPDGLTIGEGAGMLVIERLDHAIERGARIYAELLGYALTEDAHHLTAPESTGQSQRRVLVEALENAGVELGEVDYVNAHGTGTSGNDIVESRAIKMVFGERAGSIPVSSVKGALGHTLGAAGGIEALLTALVVHRDIVPPTANFKKPRPGCDLNYVPNQAIRKSIDVAVTQNFAFGGNNCAIVMGKAGRQRKTTAEVKTRRVVITGMGVITPLGCGNDDFLAALREGSCGIRPIEGPETLLTGARIGATIRDFRPSRYARAQTRRMDRLGQMTVAGAELALNEARVKLTRESAERAGLVVGTMDGPVSSCKDFHRDIVLNRPTRANPKVFPNTVFNAGIGHAAIQFRLKGCNVILTTGQASGLNAISYAFELVRAGMADLIVAGGVDELTQAVLEGYAAARRTSPWLGNGLSSEEHSCPFDLRRNGMILGEGAAFVTLEPLELAQSRDASIHGEILGYHCCADRPVNFGWDPTGEGLSRSMGRAMESAGVSSSDIHYVSAGALSHPLQDKIEADAIHSVFGRPGPPVGALSSVMGVSGATGSMALCAVLHGMREGFLPAGVNHQRPDPDCELDVVHTKPRNLPLKLGLLNSVSLGGTNVSMVVRKFE